MNFNEDTYVEQPFLEQLKQLGWEIINGDTKKFLHNISHL